jgi:hypothetical protein
MRHWLFGLHRLIGVAGLLINWQCIPQWLLFIMPLNDCLKVAPSRNIVTDLASLGNLSGNARFQCIVCSGCGPDQVNIKWFKNKRFPWAIDLCCLNCNKSWSICQLCNLLRSQLTGYMLSRHNRTKHASDEVLNSSNFVASMNGSNDHCLSTNDSNEFNSQLDDVETSSCISLMHPPHIVHKLLPYSNATSTLFFQEEATSDKLGAGATA